MIRTQIQLPEKQYKELRNLAANLNRSMADCIRESIELFLKRSRAREEDLVEIAGRFTAIPAEDLKPHDRFWADSILNEDK